MTIEQDINKLVKGSKVNFMFNQVELWEWNDYSLTELFGKDSPAFKIGLEINKLIQKAPLAICLSFSSEYIRGYRKWYETNKNP